MRAVNRLSDIRRLSELLDPEKHDIERRDRAGFQGMLNTLVANKTKELSASQRDWVLSVEERLGCDTPPPDSMFSSGKVPRESYTEPAPVPAVLMYLPKRPPGMK